MDIRELKMELETELLYRFAEWYSENKMYVSDDPIERQDVDEFLNYINNGA